MVDKYVTELMLSQLRKSTQHIHVLLMTCRVLDLLTTRTLLLCDAHTQSCIA